MYGVKNLQCKKCSVYILTLVVWVLKKSVTRTNLTINLNIITSQPELVSGKRVKQQQQQQQQQQPSFWYCAIRKVISRRKKAH